MPLLHRYILRAHAGPFIFSLATLMFIFLLQFVMKFIDQLVGKGLTAWVIIELVALNLSWMLVLAVPMSVLVATLMAFGDLSSRNEITAMKAGGVSIYRMMAPVFVASVLVGLVMVWFNNDVLPESNHRLKALTTDIRRKKPTIALVDGVFSQDIPGYSLLVRKAFPTGDLAGVTLYDYSNPTMNIVITATRGTISFSPDYRKTHPEPPGGRNSRAGYAGHELLPARPLHAPSYRHGRGGIRLRTLCRVGLCPRRPGTERPRHAAGRRQPEQRAPETNRRTPRFDDEGDGRNTQRGLGQPAAFHPRSRAAIQPTRQRLSKHARISTVVTHILLSY